LIAVDTNVLVQAHREDAPFHDQAAECLRTLAEGAVAWAIPWPCVHEFYGVATNPRIFAPPSTPAQAIAQIQAWLASPTLHLLTESQAHWRTLEPMLEAGKVRGAQVHDARIAALCVQHGVRELLTADRDFSRFPALEAVNPLVR
jgi:toxin-antitoxin system PIN domain toxin